MQTHFIGFSRAVKKDHSVHMASWLYTQGQCHLNLTLSAHCNVFIFHTPCKEQVFNNVDERPSSKETLGENSVVGKRVTALCDYDGGKCSGGEETSCFGIFCDTDCVCF